MLVNFWSNAALREECQISFSYRNTPKYTDGLQSQVQPDFPVYPLTLPPVEWPSHHFRPPFVMVSRALRVVTRLFFKYPLFIHEAWIVYRLIKKLQPDIVHLNNGGYPAARSVRAAAVGARLAGCKSVVMVVNNLAEPYTTAERWFDYFLDRWVVASTTRFVTGSVAAAERLRSVLDLDASCVQSIHNGIRLREIKETRREVLDRLGVPESYSGMLIGVVALMTERKGHRVLIDAVEILWRKDPELDKKLIIIFEGNGELRDNLQATVNNKKLEDVVKFVGEAKNVVDLINAIDVLVLPSIGSEDFPNVTLEAMALGKTVIASRLAGTPEQIVHGETGYLVEPKNSEELASVILKLICNQEIVKNMGEAGKMRFYENFTAELAVDRYLKLYRSITGQY